MGACCESNRLNDSSADSIMFEGEIWHTYGNLDHTLFSRALDHQSYKKY